MIIRIGEGYWKFKEEALDLTVWKTRFGRGYGPVVKTDCGIYETINQIRGRLNMACVTSN